MSASALGTRRSALGARRAAGFRMPAEWERHRGTWLSWPHRESSWPGKFGPVPAVFGEMVRHLAAGEEVHINVADEGLEGRARLVLERAGVVQRIVTSDEWARYELAEEFTEHHHHLICSQCGVVRDFTVAPSLERSIDKALESIAEHAGDRKSVV